MSSIFQVISLAWSLQAGMIPGLDIAAPLDNNYFTNTSPYFWQGTIEFQIPVFSWTKSDHDGLYFGGQITNLFIKDPQPNYEFTPIQDIYSVDAGIRWKELTIGYEHCCSHSIDTDVNSRIVSDELFGAFDKVFVKLSGVL